MEVSPFSGCGLEKIIAHFGVILKLRDMEIRGLSWKIIQICIKIILLISVEAI